MKELFRIIKKDYMSEGFTKKEFVIYGIAVPIALGAMIWLGGMIETLM